MMEFWLFNTPVAAGFPSPAQDDTAQPLDLEQLLITQREATFFWRVEGASMEGVGIYHGDLLVVDRSVTPVHGSIVVAVVEGGFVVKKLLRRAGEVVLCSAHPDYPEMRFSADQELVVWGVVQWSLHRLVNQTSR